MSSSLYTGLTAFGLVMFAFGCSGGGSADIGSCPTAPADADVVAGQKLIEDRCMSCHAAYRPENLDAARAQEVFDAASDGSMPPDGSFSSAQMEQLRIFLACSTDAGSDGGGDQGGGGSDQGGGGDGGADAGGAGAGGGPLGASTAPVNR